MEKTLFRVKVMRRSSAKVLSDTLVGDLYVIADSMDYASNAALSYCAERKEASGLYVKEVKVVASSSSQIPLVMAD